MTKIDMTALSSVKGGTRSCAPAPCRPAPAPACPPAPAPAPSCGVQKSGCCCL